MRKTFTYLTTAAVYYFLTAQQALAAGTGGGLAAIEVPTKTWTDTITGPIAVNFTAVAGVVAFLSYGYSSHGPGTHRAGAWALGGAGACSVVPIMTALGMSGATF